MNKQCTQCSKTFRIDDHDLEFLRRIEVPDPVICAECSARTRMAWRNERSLYTRTCAQCHKPMVTIYANDKDYTVYCNACWNSDNWDPLEYGQAYDFTRPFFDQMEELLKKVPLVNLVIGAKAVNSDFTNYSMDNVNSYLLAASDYNQDCLYSSYIFNCRDSADCLFSNNCESSYQLVDCDNCYGSQYLQNCKQCTECFYSFDCHNCTNCFGCVGLRNKEFYIFNEAYSKEEYYRKIDELKQDPVFVDKKINELKLRYPHKYAFNVNCDHSVGDYLTNCANCYQSYDLIECVDCRYCTLGYKGKDCMRCVGVPNAELMYECVAVPEDYHVKFSALIWPKSSYLEYCLFSRSSNNSFGCVALNKNEFCILNKQYTKQEYEKLIPNIKEHMTRTGEYGLFFPITMSPFAYNETAAQDYYPLSKKDILEKGWKYKDVEKVTAASGEDIAQCVECEKSFRCVQQEKEFYKKHNITTPSVCQDCRHKERLLKRNPRSLWKRQCMCTQTDHDHKGRCATEFETTYAPDRKEIVYCADCYNKEHF